MKEGGGACTGAHLFEDDVVQTTSGGVRGEKMKSEVILLRNKMRGEITDC